MSDIRTLLVNRDVEISDGCYAERALVKQSDIEAFIRSLRARLPSNDLRNLKRFVDSVNALEASVRNYHDDDLRSTLLDAVYKMPRMGFCDELLVKAFAVIREAAFRVLGKRHHDVQLMAARVLLQGKIAEMATGEGKTLAATLAVCTAVASRAAVHVVTVNDYLAERDASDNRPLYNFFGFTLGVVVQDMPIETRRQQYACDIVYVSNKELTFDYLKDRIALGSALSIHTKLRYMQNGRVANPAILRGLHVAIVDEADSVLIDEARTPLIISETVPDDIDESVYFKAIELALSLKEGIDYIKSKDRDIWLTPVGDVTVSTLTEGEGGVWVSHLWRKEMMQKALSALHLFQRDQHYIVADNKVQIVDEFTGRVMPDRTWERGLHQLIEAKERCEISGQRRTLSQVTYQRFFGRYLLLAGMTGTAKEVEPELKRVYDISVVKIPTHKLSRRVRLPDYVFLTNEQRWKYVANRVTQLSNEGRAVLVGTRSVEASEYLSDLLTTLGVTHEVLNARQDKSEAQAVAQAGHVGRVTVATNMAGRGTDIKLAQEVVENGGLHVILTEFHESARVDRQLFGRSARQGDPGTTEAVVCLEDEIFRRYAPLLSQIGKSLWLGRRKINHCLFRWLILYAQTNAERQARKIRFDTTKRDRKWLQTLGFVGMDKK